MADLAELRQHAQQIFAAGVAAANPTLALNRFLSTEHDQLVIGLTNGAVRSHAWQKVHVIAFGKAAGLMASAALARIPAQLLQLPVIAVTNYENSADYRNIELLTAAHPLPDQAGLKAAQRIAERMSLVQKNELVLVLISGGGSALIPYPINGISLAEKTQVTELLLTSGATINEINTVRKHLSVLKGGGLAKLAMPADLHALILSDVLGDDLSAIASGPTVPDPTTYADAVALLHDKQLWPKLPRSVQNHLQHGVQGLIPETPKPNDVIFARTGHSLIGSNTVSLHAMQQAASQLGYQTLIYQTQLQGEAKLEAEKLAAYAKTLNKPLALIAGGETTVTVTGQGLGGRNQEFALAFACAASQYGLTSEWTLLSGGTDGRDGPTDAAGGLIDTCSISRMLTAGLNPLARLADNDAYHALQSSGDLLLTGATGTNVADLQVLLINT
ncbi:glycerate kinase type-2 family protein [Methylocucumis oryzae]|uniref:Glycerate kinase n=1 Tax=Methylocucumis oryzae TaxID=1632867 RepID=A0A0F3ILB5_9GAMM|nr:glycerate kinase [Methylocucumis oryzae]KJV07298.1 glycerate kinase [Methylocucumis oryzae]